MIQTGKLKNVEKYEKMGLVPILMKRMNNYADDEYMGQYMFIALAPSDIILNKYEIGMTNYKEFKKEYFEELNNRKNKILPMLKSMNEKNKIILISENMAGMREKNYPDAFRQWLKCNGINSKANPL